MLLYDGMIALKTDSSQAGGEPLNDKKICEQVLGKRTRHTKGLGWRPIAKHSKTETSYLKVKEINACIAQLQSIVESQQSTIEEILRRLSSGECAFNTKRSKKQTTDN